MYGNLFQFSGIHFFLQLDAYLMKIAFQFQCTSRTDQMWHIPFYFPYYEYREGRIIGKYFEIGIDYPAYPFGYGFVLHHNPLNFGSQRKYDVSKNGLEHFIFCPEIIMQCRAVYTYGCCNITHVGVCKPVFHK